MKIMLYLTEQNVSIFLLTRPDRVEPDEKRHAILMELVLWYLLSRKLPFVCFCDEWRANVYLCSTEHFHV